MQNEDESEKHYKTFRKMPLSRLGCKVKIILKRMLTKLIVKYLYFNNKIIFYKTIDCSRE
jgi:hypothetical protein